MANPDSHGGTPIERQRTGERQKGATADAVQPERTGCLQQPHGLRAERRITEHDEKIDHRKDEGENGILRDLRFGG